MVKQYKIQGLFDAQVCIKNIYVFLLLDGFLINKSGMLL